MTQPARFTQSDVKRAVRGAIEGGMAVGEMMIDPNGNIVVKAPVAARKLNPRDDWDTVLV